MRSFHPGHLGTHSSCAMYLQSSQFVCLDPAMSNPTVTRSKIQGLRILRFSTSKEVKFFHDVELNHEGYQLDTHQNQILSHRVKTFMLVIS